MELSLEILSWKFSVVGNYHDLKLDLCNAFDTEQDILIYKKLNKYLWH